MFNIAKTTTRKKLDLLPLFQVSQYQTHPLSLISVWLIFSTIIQSGPKKVIPQF